MQKLIEVQERRTSADIVFDHLHDAIVSLDLMPGAKISEAEIAAQFGVSRQPVRDAFNRLSNIDLLVVRPQKATKVKKFSLGAIEAARFVRLAVELEVLSRAATRWTGRLLPRFERNLADQHVAAAAQDAAAFHRLDYAFHSLLCEAAEADFATAIIARSKAQADRLCVLSLKTADSMRELVRDHETLLAMLQTGDKAGLGTTIRLHLSRLDATIEDVHRKHSDYFQD